MTNLLYFSSLFPTPAWPHLGMFSVQRIRALHNAGCKVIVVCPVLITLPARLLLKPRKLLFWVKGQLKLPIEANYQGIQVYYPKWVWFPKGLFGWYTSYFLYRQVRKRVTTLLMEFKPDVILSSWLPDGLAACMLGSLLGIPTISIADGSDVNQLSYSYPGWKYACRCLNNESSTVIFVSKALKDKANSLGLHGGTNIILHNAADIHLFQANSTKPDNSIYTVLGVGRLVPVKGFHILLSAFALLYRQLNQQARLILVGEGPLREALTQQATDLDILMAVDFVGAVSHEEIVSYYQQAHVFCLSSFSEGSPTVIVEAMACGLPVVASDVGGVGEIINPETGFLVTPGNPKLLYEALLRAKERDWNRDAIRQEVENHYEWERWTEVILRLIRSSQVQQAELR